MLGGAGPDLCIWQSLWCYYSHRSGFQASDRDAHYRSVGILPAGCTPLWLGVPREHIRVLAKIIALTASLETHFSRLKALCDSLRTQGKGWLGGRVDLGIRQRFGFARNSPKVSARAPPPSHFHSSVQCRFWNPPSSISLGGEFDRPVFLAVVFGRPPQADLRGSEFLWVVTIFNHLAYYFLRLKSI